jgi:transposase
VTSIRARAALDSTRTEFLTTEADQLEAELKALVSATWRELVELPGLAVLTASQVLINWSHRGRIRSKAEFAALAGAAPIPVSCVID